MSELKYFLLYFLVIFSLGVLLGFGMTLLDKTLNPKPQCTAYQAIDGKPVCIEYQLNK